MWSVISLSTIRYFAKVIIERTGQQRKYSKEMSSANLEVRFGSTVNGVVEAGTDRGHVDTLAAPETRW